MLISDTASPAKMHPPKAFASTARPQETVNPVRMRVGRASNGIGGGGVCTNTRLRPSPLTVSCVHPGPCSTMVYCDRRIGPLVSTMRLHGRLRNSTTLLSGADCATARKLPGPPSLQLVTRTCAFTAPADNHSTAARRTSETGRRMARLQHPGRRESAFHRKQHV